MRKWIQFFCVYALSNLFIQNSYSEIAPAELEFIEYINMERSALGRPTLEPNDDLSSIARNQSDDMLRGNFFSHFSSTTGTSSFRIRTARIAASKTVEFIARETSASNAHEKLMQSPRYVDNILEREFKQAGVGIASKPDGELYFTILLIKPIKKADAQNETHAIFDAINVKRKALNLPLISQDKRLNKIALKACEYMNKTGRSKPGNTIKIGMNQTNVPFRSYRTVFRRSKEPQSILQNKLLYDTRFRQIGIGMLMNDSTRMTYGSFLVAIILVEPM